MPGLGFALRAILKSLRTPATIRARATATARAGLGAGESGVTAAKASQASMSLVKALFTNALNRQRRLMGALCHTGMVAGRETLC